MPRWYYGPVSTPALLLSLSLSLLAPSAPKAGAPSPSARARAIERMNEGVTLARRSKAWDAERALREATSIDPSLPHAWLNLGHLLLRAQRSEEAAEAFRRGLGVATGELKAELHLQLGLVLLDVARVEPDRHERAEAMRVALGHLQVATEHGAGFASTYVEIGRAHEALDQLAQADAAYRRALEVDPSHAPAFVALGKLYVDCGYGGIGIDVLALGAKYNDGDARAWRGLGEGLAQLDEHRKAINAFERARRLDPHDVELLFALGISYAELHERQAAIERLQQFLMLAGPEVPAAMVQIANHAIARMQDVI